MGLYLGGGGGAYIQGGLQYVLQRCTKNSDNYLIFIAIYSYFSYF